MRLQRMAAVMLLLVHPVGTVAMADSLLIVYRSGATQRVELKEPAENVSTWRVEESGRLLPKMSLPPPSETNRDDIPISTLPRDGKSDTKVRIRLDAPPIRE